MKKGMVDCYQAGVFDVLTPHLTVHDELDVSAPDTKEGHEAIAEMKDICEHTIELKVPLIMDIETGPNWADVEEYKV